MRLKSLRLNLARFLVVVSFVWPFINANYFFPESTVEINFLLVFLAIGLAPELLFEDLSSLLLIIVAVALAAVWGPTGSALRLVVGVLPCIFLPSLYRRFRSCGKELIPRSLAYVALLAFVGFCILQHINFNVFPIIPDWLTRVFATIVPRYMDAPYDEFGMRGVQGWASEPSSAAMTCFAFSVVAIDQEPKKRWLILFAFAVLAALNKSVYGMLFLVFLAVVSVWGMRRKLHALLVVIPIGAVFSYFVVQSSRVTELRENLLIFGLSQDSNRELLRFAQIVYPLAAFPRMYRPVSVLGLDMQPLGLLPLLIGYGSIVGCILYYRLTFRNFHFIDVGSMPLALAAVFALTFMSSANFLPVIVAFAYATAPKQVAISTAEDSARISWLGQLKRLLAESARVVRREAAQGEQEICAGIRLRAHSRDDGLAPGSAVVGGDKNMNTSRVNLDRLVSVIMPAKDTANYIAAAIESVIAQDYPYWELLVVDDQSRDGTTEIIKGYAAGDTRITYLSLGPGGPTGASAARNHATRMSRGRYIAFLDSDDVWYPNKLSIQLGALEAQKAALCYSAYRKMSEEGTVGERAVQVPARTCYKDLLKSNVIGCLTAIYDTTAAGKVFLPEVSAESLHYFEDYAMWLRIARELTDQRKVFVGVQEPLAIYRLRRGSISYRKWKAARYTWRVYRRIERLPLHASIYYFCHYAVQGLKKYAI
jgi:glycosyltransferase involved in cell wall biosynthesis